MRIKKDKSTSIVKVNDGLNLSKGIKKRLQNKLVERNEDLILDYLEQIEIHKREIGKLVNKINELSSTGYILEEDENV